MSFQESDWIGLTIGTAGGIASFLVGNGTGLRNLLAAGFVGGFAAVVFPPMIIYGLEQYNIIFADEKLVMGISGFIGAISWQLLTTIKAVVPDLLNIILRRFGYDKPKEDYKENGCTQTGRQEVQQDSENK